MSYTYRYPHPAVTVDFVLFGVDLERGDEALQVLLIRRGGEPFKGAYALPGGFVNIDEDLEAAARRELREETGVGAGTYVEQLRTFGRPDRDPRERVISVAFLALIRSDAKPKAGDDASAAEWMSVDAALHASLAFDHAEILTAAVERLRAKVRYAPIGFDLLPKSFTLVTLQRLYEVVLGKKLDKGNFRRRIHHMGILTRVGKFHDASDRRRIAQLYRYDRDRYDRAVERGFEFEV